MEPLLWNKADKLNVIQQEVNECTKCKLCQGRQNVVFGEGNHDANVVFCGEAPGATEDECGRPFVGRAGKLLDNMIDSMGLKRKDVYILNVCKCRPPSNRTPTPAEMAACVPYLHKQITLIAPEVIVALGNTALGGLTMNGSGITKRCGVWEDYEYITDLEMGLSRKVKLMPCYHPSALLRNPKWKEPAWHALQKVAKETG